MLAAHKTQLPHRVFLKMNSGMNRLGFTPERYRAAWTRLNALPQVDEISLMTHFLRRRRPQGHCGGAQGLRRRHARPAGRAHPQQQRGQPAPWRRTGRRSDWVRPGILMYGSAPDFPEHSAAQWDLLPTMTLSSKIISVQELKAGDTVGYGSSFTADGPMRIGIVACGYADGYPRHCSTGTPVLVGGVRARMVGRVSMDMITVDLTPTPAAGIGTEVTLWGKASSGALMPIDEVAQAGGTVGYELMCAVAARVPIQAE
jgi:alanine racemase